LVAGEEWGVVRVARYEWGPRQAEDKVAEKGIFEESKE